MICHGRDLSRGGWRMQCGVNDKRNPTTAVQVGSVEADAGQSHHVPTL